MKRNSSTQLRLTRCGKASAWRDWRPRPPDRRKSSRRSARRRQVSFKVAPGQRMALVGASGAGKSTIVSLILRLYEAQEGAILIDGVDIRQYRRESLRRQIGLVLQQSLLFGATIRENIAYGR